MVGMVWHVMVVAWYVEMAVDGDARGGVGHVVVGGREDGGGWAGHGQHVLVAGQEDVVWAPKPRTPT